MRKTNVEKLYLEVSSNHEIAYHILMNIFLLIKIIFWDTFNAGGAPIVN